MLKVFRTAIVPAILLLGSGTAAAATASTNLPVSATVLSACLVTATTPVAFGNYDPTSGTDKTGAGLITVTCTSGTSYNLLLNKGANGADVTTRKMVSGSDELAYSLHRDSGRTQNWGQTIGTDTVADSISGLVLVKTHDVYGKITAGQVAPAGAYTDTVLLTIDY